MGEVKREGGEWRVVRHGEKMGEKQIENIALEDKERLLIKGQAVSGQRVMTKKKWEMVEERFCTERFISFNHSAYIKTSAEYNCWAHRTSALSRGGKSQR